MSECSSQEDFFRWPSVMQMTAKVMQFHHWRTVVDGTFSIAR
jgi:hypothetical protein